MVPNPTIAFLPKVLIGFDSNVGTSSLPVDNSELKNLPTEDDVLSPAASNKGVVQGLVTKGKMYVAEKDGTQQVQYTQRQEPAGTNYIYYGQ